VHPARIAPVVAPLHDGDQGSVGGVRVGGHIHEPCPIDRDIVELDEGGASEDRHDEDQRERVGEGQFSGPEESR